MLSSIREEGLLVEKGRQADADDVLRLPSQPTYARLIPMIIPQFFHAEARVLMPTMLSGRPCSNPATENPPPPMMLAGFPRGNPAMRKRRPLMPMMLLAACAALL